MMDVTAIEARLSRVVEQLTAEPSAGPYAAAVARDQAEALVQAVEDRR